MARTPSPWFLSGRPQSGRSRTAALGLGRVTRTLRDSTRAYAMLFKVMSPTVGFTVSRSSAHTKMLAVFLRRRSRGVLGPSLGTTGVAIVLLATTSCSGVFGVASKAAQFRESVDIWSLAFSADGRQVATSSPNRGEVDVWEWQGTPHVVRNLEHPKGGRPNGLRYSLDGRFLAVAHGVDAEQELLRVWNAATGEFVAEISDPAEVASALEASSFAFTRDGQFLLRSQSGRLGPGDPPVNTLVLHETKTWAKVWALQTPEFHPYTLDVSRDGHFAAVVGWEREMPHLRTKLLLIDLHTRNVRFSTVIVPDSCHVRFVAWSPDGRQIAVTGSTEDDGSQSNPPNLLLIDAASGQPVSSFPGGYFPAALDYSPNGKYLVVGWLNVGIEIWNAAHTKLFERIPGHLSGARFSPDGRLATAEAGDITIWDLQ